MDAETEGPHTAMHSTAVLLASLVLPASLLAGRIVEAILDTANPDEVRDLNHGLAYLTEILTWSFAVAGVVITGFVLSTVAVWARARTFRAIRLPVIVFAVQVVVAVALMVANQAIDVAEGI